MDEDVLYPPSIKLEYEPLNKDFIYLDLDEDYYHNSLGVEPPLYEINTTEEYGDSKWRDSVSNCEISFGEEGPATQDLICILDIMEGMCSYLITEPAWLWNKRPGRKTQKLDIGGRVEQAGTFMMKTDYHLFVGTYGQRHSKENRDQKSSHGSIWK